MDNALHVQVTFTLLSVNDDVDVEQVCLEVHGPNSKPPVRVRWDGAKGMGEFVPVEPGPHKVMKHLVCVTDLFFILHE